MEIAATEEQLEALKGADVVINISKLPHRDGGYIAPGVRFRRRKIGSITAYVSKDIYRPKENTYGKTALTYEWFSEDFVALNLNEIFGIVGNR